MNVAFIFYPFPLYKSINRSILHTLGCIAVFFKQVDYSSLACIVCRTNNIEHVLALRHKILGSFCHVLVSVIEHLVIIILGDLFVLLGIACKLLLVIFLKESFDISRLPCGIEVFKSLLLALLGFTLEASEHKVIDIVREVYEHIHLEIHRLNFVYLLAVCVGSGKKEVIKTLFRVKV